MNTAQEQKPHLARGTGENEWYTPAQYIEAARDVLGAIDLDPASSEQAQETIAAGSFLTKEQDGLANEWHGRVWLNPPYSKPLIGKFVNKLVAEYESGRVTEAILLTHNYTDTKWFAAARTAASALCLPTGRIKFVSPDGELAAPTQGQAFFYFGKSAAAFLKRFATFGMAVPLQAANDNVALHNCETSPLDLALEYASQGWPVFPCDPSDKKPHTLHGFKDASLDERRIRSWWTRYPNAMVGVPTGEASGIWLLDIDNRPEDGKDGPATLATLVAEHGALPQTVSVRTPSGGSHLLFKCGGVEVRNRGSIGPGIDVRGDGGYVIVPGSVRSDGRFYEWATRPDEPAEAPDWLVAKVVRPKAAKEPRAATGNINQPYVAAAIASELTKLIGTGSNRNNQLNDSAFAIGQFVPSGAVSYADMETRLFGAALACGYVAKDGEAAARATIKSGLEAGIAEPRVIPEAKRDDYDKAEAAEAAERLVQSVTNDNEPQDPKEKGRFNLTWFDDIESSMAKETIIKGILGVNEFTLLSGLPGSGKSIIATDAACHVAAGMEWFSRKVRQGLVVYVAAERKALTERRLLAFRKHHVVSGVPLLVLGGSIDFTSSIADAEAIVASIKSAEEECGHACVWVIIDTLTRTFGPGDQNASKDMGRFIRACDVLQAKTCAHVTVVHHTAWTGERGKGAIDLDGAVDASFLVQKNRGEHVLKCDGANDGAEGVVCRFGMKGVHVGTDEDGEPTEAPVVVTSDAAEAVDTLLAGIKGHNQAVLESLREAIAKAGEVPPAGSAGFPDGVLVVNRETWRGHYYEGVTPPTNKDTLKKRFNRAVEALVSGEHVYQTGDWFWPRD